LAPGGSAPESWVPPTSGMRWPRRRAGRPAGGVLRHLPQGKRRRPRRSRRTGEREGRWIAALGEPAHSFLVAGPVRLRSLREAGEELSAARPFAFPHRDPDEGRLDVPSTVGCPLWSRKRSARS
jgi:hypothetical protein